MGPRPQATVSLMASAFSVDSLRLGAANSPFVPVPIPLWHIEQLWVFQICNPARAGSAAAACCAAAGDGNESDQVAMPTRARQARASNERRRPRSWLATF